MKKSPLRKQPPDKLKVEQGANIVKDKKAETYLKAATIFFGMLFLFSLFINIGHPLFWADESMTVMGAERVVHFGYPKAHDGKNVINDMSISNPSLAINKKDDAFIGGANWGHYYYGAIGYLLAENADDLYLKTAIFRATFAIIGLLGLLILSFTVVKCINDKFYAMLFIFLFLFAEIISITLVLHIKEVRYYSIAIFFTSLISSLYILFRFYKPFNRFLFGIALTVSLWLLFNTFSPLYFIFIITLVLSELAIIVSNYLITHQFATSVKPSLIVFISIIISFAGVLPLLSYFRTFELEKLLDKDIHFDFSVYSAHLTTVLHYFSGLELLWLALVMKTGILFNFKKVIEREELLFKVSTFLTLLFIVFILSIPKVTIVFTRYLISMQPVLSIIAISDFILLLKMYSAKGTLTLNTNTAIVTSLFLLLFGFTIYKNLPYIKGHLYEMTHVYKGPLDYTIPYIKEHFPRTDTMTIAATYEETSFMYYLKSKVILGFMGNNLAIDSTLSPQIVSYRQCRGTFFPKVFNLFVTRDAFTRVTFPVKDIPCNNIPQLVFEIPSLQHYFKTPLPEDDKDAEALLIGRKAYPIK